MGNSTLAAVEEPVSPYLGSRCDRDLNAKILAHSAPRHISHADRHVDRHVYHHADLDFVASMLEVFVDDRGVAQCIGLAWDAGGTHFAAMPAGSCAADEVVAMVLWRRSRDSAVNAVLLRTQRRSR